MNAGIFAGYTVRAVDSEIRPGMTLAERQALRQQLHDEAMTRIKRASWTALCESDAHDLCRGEEPGCCGRLCECHDVPKASERSDPEGEQ